MSFFTVKNFEKFQHYKDRAPPWIKLYNELLENYEFGRLPDAQKGQIIGIWLLASRMENKLPMDPIWIASKINANSPVDLDALIEAGFIVLKGDTDTPKNVEQVATPAQRMAKSNGFGSRHISNVEQVATPAQPNGFGSRHISDEVKRSVWQRDGGKCCECGAGETIEYDHKHPVSKGGSSEEDNIQLLCRACNRRKRTRLATPAQPSAEPRERERGETEGETEERKEDSEAKASAANGTFEGSDEDQFWSLADPAAKAGIARSRLGQLLKFSDGDFRAALSILKSTLRKKEPAAYLGKALAAMRDETKLDAAVEARDPSIPEFVHEAKAEGIPVKRRGENWEIGPEIFNAEGRMVGW